VLGRQKFSRNSPTRAGGSDWQPDRPCAGGEAGSTANHAPPSSGGQAVVTSQQPPNALVPHAHIRESPDALSGFSRTPKTGFSRIRFPPPGRCSPADGNLRYEPTSLRVGNRAGTPRFTGVWRQRRTGFGVETIPSMPSYPRPHAWHVVAVVARYRFHRRRRAASPRS